MRQPLGVICQLVEEQQRDLRYLACHVLAAWRTACRGSPLSRAVHLAARPEPITVVPEETALIVVDM
jgi:hypothetical protein